MSAYGAFLWLTGRRREGASVAAGAIAFGVLTLGVLVPLATGGELEKLAGPGNRYGWLGDGMAEVLWTTVTSPVAVLGELLRPDKLRLPLYLLVCGGFVCGRAWRFLLLLVPLLAVGLLAAGSWMTRVTGTYYWITAELVVVMACVLAASPRRPRFAIGRGRLAYLGAATLAVSVALSPLPYGAFASWDDFRPSPSARTFAEVRALIPPDAAVSVQTNLGAHLSQRADVAQFPRRLHCADFALLHLRYEGGPRLGLFTQANMYFLTHHPQPRALPSAARRLVEDPRWSLVFSGEGFYLFARGAPAIVSDAEALGRIERDAAVLRRQLDSTAPVSFRMARYLNGPLDWKDLL